MKNKHKLRADQLLANLEQTAIQASRDRFTVERPNQQEVSGNAAADGRHLETFGPSTVTGGHNEGSDEDTQGLISLATQPIQPATDTSKLRRLKRFRSQLLHQWLIHNFSPCKVADIGGGKGLLGYLLQESGWQVCVIDPVQQPLPEKYKDIVTESRVKIPPGARVPCRAMEFEPEMAQGFDLLIGMHAHGCNVKIIDAAARYGCGFVIFPCCVINEPFHPPCGVHWLESLANYAVQQGHIIYPFRLNFKGQSIGIFGSH